MLPGYDKKSNAHVGLAIVLALLGVVTYFCAGVTKGTAAENLLMIIGSCCWVACVFFWHVGLGFYLVGKGYSAVMVIVGVLGVVGLGIALLLPDRNKVNAGAADVMRL